MRSFPEQVPEVSEALRNGNDSFLQHLAPINRVLVLCSTFISREFLMVVAKLAADPRLGNVCEENKLVVLFLVLVEALVNYLRHESQMSSVVRVEVL